MTDLDLDVHWEYSSDDSTADSTVVQMASQMEDSSEVQMDSH